MRSYEHHITKALRTGLTPRANVPKTGDFLLECHNLRVKEIGLVPYKELVDSFGGKTSWPNSQIFCCDDEEISYDGTVAVSNTRPWELVSGLTPIRRDFIYYKDYSIITGPEMVIIDNSGLSIFNGDDKMPTFRTGCDFNGQIIGGYVVSDWYDCGPNSIVWSEIGNASFALNERNTMGYKNFLDGDILRVGKLGNFVVIYTRTSVWQMFPTDTTFGFKKLLEFGPKHFWSVGISENEHIFICDTGDLIHINNEGSVSVLGYDLWFNSGDWIIEYSPIEKEFYITEPNLLKSFLLTRQGLSTVHQTVISIGQKKNGQVIGLFHDDHDVSFKWLTTTNDFMQRSKKTLQSFEFSGRYKDQLTLYVGWSNNYNRPADTFQYVSDFRFSPSGKIIMPVSGVNFRIGMSSSNYYDKDLLIDRLTIRLQYDDFTSIGGPFQVSGEFQNAD